MRVRAFRCRHFQKVARIVIAVLPVVAAPNFSPTDVQATGPAAVEALLIGDSVLNGLAQPYSSEGRAALAARHSFILDTAGCRRLITTSCRIPPAPAPTSAITVLRSRAGQYDRALVVAAGYDDPPTGEFGIGAAVDVMLAEAHRQGIEHVIWLTYREAGSAGHTARFRQSNEVLRSRSDPGLILADWATLSAGMPSSWFSADGIHLGPQASAAMGELIGDALDQVPVVPVRCTTGIWSGDAVPPGSSTTAAADGGLHVLPKPIRLVDTRELPGKLGDGHMLRVQVTGTAANVPGDATAALVSVTAVEPCADTFLTVFPCGAPLPTASMVNATAYSIVANSAVVRLGSGGALCVYSLRPTDVVVDISGWVAPGGLRSRPVAPVRLVDSRPGEHQTLPVAQRRLGAGNLLTVDIASVAGVDPNATAATVNVTAVNPAGNGFLSVLPGPCASATVPPTTSNLNVTTGRDVAASATVGIGGGELCVFSSTETDVVVDLQATHGDIGGSLVAVEPRRIVDTRSTHRLVPGQPLALVVENAPAGVVVNVTAVEPSGRGFLTVYPCGTTVPIVSNLNVVAGAIVANRAVVATGASGRFCVFSSVDTDVVVDLEGSIRPD